MTFTLICHSVLGVDVGVGLLLAMGESKEAGAEAKVVVVVMMAPPTKSNDCRQKMTMLQVVQHVRDLPSKLTRPQTVLCREWNLIQ